MGVPENSGNEQKLNRWLRLLPAALLAAVIACGILYQSAHPYVKKDVAMPNVVILGDSIMGKERYVTTVDSVIANVTGLSVFNGAFGGTTASSNNTQNRYSYHEDSLNLSRLQDAIVHQDFGVQMADLQDNPFQADYFQQTMKKLSQINFSKVDVLLIEHGTNDYSSKRPLDNADDPMDAGTYAGALRLTISNLQKTYPNLKIILVTPTFCWISGYEDCTRQDFGYGTMDKFVEREQEIAAQYGLDVIDAYHNTGFQADNIAEYTEDGIHLNEAGREKYGTYLGEQLNHILASEQ